MSSTIRENIQRIQYRIARARQKSPYENEVTLIAVSKTHPAESIREAYDAGLRHFGENRVQEWEGKRDQLHDLSATWHLIGHLQSNKSAKAAKLFHSIDSVDDLSLAQRLNNSRGELPATEIPAAAAPNKKLRVLIEVHIAAEATKSGSSIDSLPDLLTKSSTLDHLDLAGLMCIPPFLDDPEQVRPYFQRLKKLRDHLAASINLPLPVLSMGMSHDFEVAIEEGATEVRIGSAIFGTRPKP
jgi:pyridoxal phosphate enzyme (YggS family)